MIVMALSSFVYKFACTAFGGLEAASRQASIPCLSARQLVSKPAANSVKFCLRDAL